MKKNYLLIAVTFISLITNVNAQAPNWLWAKGIGGAGNDNGNSITIDASGNVYTTGFFEDTVDFDPGAGIFNLTSDSGSDDIFISKLDSSGNFIWATAMGGTGADVGNSITVEASGN